MKRRRFSKTAKHDLIELQNIREHVRSYAPIVPVHREPELVACDLVVEALQDILLEGKRLNRLKAQRQLAAVAAFTADIRVEAEEGNDAREILKELPMVVKKESIGRCET